MTRAVARIDDSCQLYLGNECTIFCRRNRLVVPHKRQNSLFFKVWHCCLWKFVNWHIYLLFKTPEEMEIGSYSSRKWGYHETPFFVAFLQWLKWVPLKPVQSSSSHGDIIKIVESSLATILVHSMVPKHKCLIVTTPLIYFTHGSNLGGALTSLQSLWKRYEIWPLLWFSYMDQKWLPRWHFMQFLNISRTLVDASSHWLCTTLAIKYWTYIETQLDVRP